MNVLGIHTSHDSSAALIRDSRIVADVAEERFTRIKHYSGLPVHAVEYCLRSQNLTMADIDAVAVPVAGRAPDLNFLFDLKGARRETKSRQRQALEFVWENLNRPQEKPPLYFRDFPLHPKTEIVHVEHHLAHAASAYYTNPISDSS